MRIRNIFLLIVAILLIVFGVRLAIPQVICAVGLAQQRCYFGGILAYTSGGMIFLGLFVIWEDFVRPQIFYDRKATQDQSTEDQLSRQSSKFSGHAQWRKGLSERRKTRKTSTDGQQTKIDQELARLEARLRTAILSQDARERLIKEAMQNTPGNRASAIRKVLSDLNTEHERWS